MTDAIEYYFTSISPFAYLGHKTLMDISQKHNIPVEFKPFNIFKVWEQSGSIPPAERSPIRQRYRLVEIQRIAVFRNVCMNAKPAHFPTDPTLADHCICSLEQTGSDAASFSQAVGRAVWEQNQQIADEACLSNILDECGHNAAEILVAAKSNEAIAKREQNTMDAIANDAIGAPAYVYHGEVFWGQDRLEQLEQMIASGRKPFTSDI